MGDLYKEMGSFKKKNKKKNISELINRKIFKRKIRKKFIVLFQRNKKGKCKPSILMNTDRNTLIYIIA